MQAILAFCYCEFRRFCKKNIRYGHLLVLNPISRLLIEHFLRAAWTNSSKNAFYFRHLYFSTTYSYIARLGDYQISYNVIISSTRLDSGYDTVAVLHFPIKFWRFERVLQNHASHLIFSFGLKLMVLHLIDCEYRDMEFDYNQASIWTEIWTVCEAK